MSRISAATFKKNGFEHIKEKDFSDDGSRFTAWKLGDLYATYHYSDDYGHFLAIRFDMVENGPSYEEYSKFGAYHLTDMFNGFSGYDMEDRFYEFVNNFHRCLDSLREWRNGEKVHFTYHVDITNSEVKIFNDDYKELDTIDINDLVYKLHREAKTRAEETIKTFHTNGKNYEVDVE